MPSLENVYQYFQQDRFLLLTIDVGEKESTVRKFIEERGFSFPVLLDRDGKVASQYGVRAHPIAYLIDPEGNIVGVAQGYREWDRPAMKAWIASLLPEL